MHRVRLVTVAPRTHSVREIATRAVGGPDACCGRVGPPRDPRADVFASIVALAGRTFWLNPEPRLYWNYGDSVMAAYERHTTAAFECWTTRHLENFVNVVAGGTPLVDQG